MTVISCPEISKIRITFDHLLEHVIFTDVECTHLESMMRPLAWRARSPYEHFLSDRFSPQPTGVKGSSFCGPEALPKPPKLWRNEVCLKEERVNIEVTGVGKRTNAATPFYLKISLAQVEADH